MRYEFRDNQNHETELVCVSSALASVETHHLFRVVLWNPYQGMFHEPIMVLASGEEAAISQAACKYKLSVYKCETPEDYEALLESTRCERVPLLIRGWGNQIF